MVTIRLTTLESACAVAVSAINWAPAWSVITETEARSRRLIERNTTAIAVTIPNMIRVMTSAAPRFALKNFTVSA